MKKSAGARARRRVDLVLVDRGLTASREKAQAVILAGLVSASGVRIDKPGTLVPEDADLTLAHGPRFVGRGGDKLDGVLDLLGLDVRGISALDAGASTGGFTDCLLQRGAAHVVALDVGRGQLDWRLRSDPRVVVHEGVNVRYLEPESVVGPFDLIVADVSFISLRLVLPVLFPRIRRTVVSGALSPLSTGRGLPGLLALIKPQFEAGRGEVGKGGVVRDPETQFTAIVSVVEAVSGASGDSSSRPAATEPAASSGVQAYGAVRIVESPLRGAEGNREFFVYFREGEGLAEGSLADEARRAVSGDPSTEREDPHA